MSGGVGKRSVGLELAEALVDDSQGFDGLRGSRRRWEEGGPSRLEQSLVDLGEGVSEAEPERGDEVVVRMRRADDESGPGTDTDRHGPTRTSPQGLENPSGFSQLPQPRRRTRSLKSLLQNVTHASGKSLDRERDLRTPLDGT